MVAKIFETEAMREGVLDVIERPVDLSATPSPTFQMGSFKYEMDAEMPGRDTGFNSPLRVLLTT
jgi:hypothetical protein